MQPREWSAALQQPAERRVLRHVALHEQRALAGIQPTGDEESSTLKRALFERETGSIALDSDRMKIYYAIQTGQNIFDLQAWSAGQRGAGKPNTANLVITLQRSPLLQSTKIVTCM
jgi:hypothetical protein